MHQLYVETFYEAEDFDLGLVLVLVLPLVLDSKLDLVPETLDAEGFAAAAAADFAVELAVVVEVVDSEAVVGEEAADPGSEHWSVPTGPEHPFLVGLAVPEVEGGQLDVGDEIWVLAVRTGG